MVKKRMRITLKSDLCAGSGYSYAGIVDSDICYDSLGIPYIPGRRLKGCLREAAELIGILAEERDALFGKGGSDGVKGIWIENAHIEHYDEIRKELETMSGGLRPYITPQSVLAQFTTVKAQTKIGEDGSADDHSLRFTRTVNHYSPVTEDKETEDKEMVFQAEIALPEDMSEDLEKKLEWCVKALRNIGMNRNRGLGSVRCTLESEPPGEPDADKPILSLEELDDETEVVLQYTIRNTAPLVMSTSNDFKTETYISGRSVLGYFAGRYLQNGHSADDAEFADIFLKNQVKFGSLYPTHFIQKEDRERGEKTIVCQDIYYPAPAYINRLKKTKVYVNVSKEVPGTEEECKAKGIPECYARGNGNQPKRLNGKYVCRKGDRILIKEPATDIVYHHTKKSKKREADDGNLLYTTEVLREQQYFSGEITGKGKYIKKLAAILSSSPIRFGKSKGAQYGTCVLETMRTESLQQGKPFHCQKGTKLLAVLESDGMFLNDCDYTVRCPEVRELIRKALELEEDNKEEVYSELEAATLTGYYGKWNLHRLAVPVVKAGSAFEFALTEDFEAPSDVLWVGENNGEGFGRIRLIENVGKDCRIKEGKETGTPAETPKESVKLMRKILLKEAKNVLMDEAIRVKAEFKNPAALGRVTLMLSESLYKHSKDAFAAYQDYRNRIASIKTKEVKETAENILKEYIYTGDDRTEESLKKNLKYLEKIKELGILYNEFIIEDEKTPTFESEMLELWGEYLMAILIQEKYRLKQQEGQV